MLRAAFALFTVATSSAMSAPEPEVPVAIQPSGKWIVEFADSRCVASRSYSIGDESWAIGLEPSLTDGEASLFVRAPRREGGFENAQIFIGGTRIAQKHMFPNRVDPKGGVLYVTGLEQNETARLRSAGRLRIERGRQVTDFAIPGLQQLKPVLDECVASLLAEWGLSRERQAQIASYPEPERDSYATPEDYPSDALRREAAGRADISVLVGVDGRPKDCTVKHSSGDKDLDAKSCSVYLKRARFRPARDKSGKTVEAPYFTNVTWRLM